MALGVLQLSLQWAHLLIVLHLRCLATYLEASEKKKGLPHRVGVLRWLFASWLVCFENLDCNLLHLSEVPDHISNTKEMMMES
jgi:hypothetical protein